MSRSKAFANAPDLKRDFDPRTDELRPPIDAAKWPTRDEVDHLDLADRALTPGGELEYRVHKAVRRGRTSQWLQPSKTPSLTDKQELDFSRDYGQAAGKHSSLGKEKTSTDLPPAAMKADIDRRLAETSHDFDRSAKPDRGTPER